MFQSWTHLTFLHWRYQASVIQSLLPPALSLDTYGGSAWIGLTPFIVENLRAPFTPSIPWMSHFPETNVRTYVTGPDGKPGIWFFTLDADRLAAVLGARLAYGLPYRWARMRVLPGRDTVTYLSRRHKPFVDAGYRISVRIRDRVIPDELARFLTARFTLYTLLYGRLAFARVEHEPWPLNAADILDLQQDIVEGSGLRPVQGGPLAHYSAGVHVRIDRPRFVVEH